MPVKREKLEQLIKKLLHDTPDHSTLTVRIVKRAIEDDLGLDSGDLDSQTDVVKEILLGALEEQEGEEEAPSTTTQPENPAKRKSEDIAKSEEAVEESVQEEVQDEGGEEEEKPTAKKAKPTIERKSTSEKKGGSSTKPQRQETEDGTVYYELHELKRVTLKDWQGNMHVDLRNFYKKDGEILPTSKGVMLTRDQWQALKENIDAIDKMINKM